MNLTSQAVGLGTLIGVVLTAGLVAAISHEKVYKHPISAPGLAPEAKNVYTAAYALTIIVPALCALVFVTTVSSCITSSVTTLFVCWAEDPAALAASNHELHAKFHEISARFLTEHPFDAGPGLSPLGPSHVAYYNVPPSPPSTPPPGGRSATSRPSTPTAQHPEYEAPPDSAPPRYAYAVPIPDLPPPFATAAAPASSV
jgi:hypothetical protein